MEAVGIAVDLGENAKIQVLENQFDDAGPVGSDPQNSAGIHKKTTEGVVAQISRIIGPGAEVEAAAGRRIETIKPFVEQGQPDPALRIAADAANGAVGQAGGIRWIIAEGGQGPCSWIDPDEASMTADSQNAVRILENGVDRGHETGIPGQRFDPESFGLSCPGIEAIEALRLKSHPERTAGIQAEGQDPVAG